MASRTSCVTKTEVFFSYVTKAQKLALKIDAGYRIEQRRRVPVEEKDLGIDSERSGDSDALPLAARKFARQARREIQSRQSDALQQFLDPHRYLLCGPSFERRHRGPTLRATVKWGNRPLS